MNLQKNYPFLILIFLQLFLLIQLKFTFWPEMILYPYLMLHNFVLFKDIINPYFPLLSVILWLYFQVVGLSILNLKILTWLVILISDGALIYSMRFFYKKRRDQLISLLVFILLQIYFGGNGLWFELMLAPFILLSLILVYFYPQNLKKIIISAILFS